MGHTKGEWVAQTERKWANQDISVFAVNPKSGNPDWIARVYNGKDATGQVGEANALLIAAAPAMLEALQAYIFHGDEGFVREKAQAAITKAKGEGEP